MAIALTAKKKMNTVYGNQRVRVWDLAFSGNYATNGETLTASQLGLKEIYRIEAPGIIQAADGATANGVTFTVSASGKSVVVETYEGAASGAAFGEKTNAEAYATGAAIRIAAIGV